MTATRTWTDWTCAIQVSTASDTALDPAVDIVRRVMAEVQAACDRFDPASELRALEHRLPSGAEVSETLAILVGVALDAAEASAGAVDPTAGSGALGPAAGATIARTVAHGVEVELVEREPGWRRVTLQGRSLTVPADLRLDLGATAKAWAADESVRRIAEQLPGERALVSLGGDLATTPGRSGWEVLVQDLDDDPAEQVRLSDGWSMATSSTQRRRLDGGAHHLIDPGSSLSAPVRWRTATVVARRCVAANAASTGSVVRGAGALDRLQLTGYAARLVDAGHRIRTTAGWPSGWTERVA